MSLFKARDWWSTLLGEKEEFDQGCLCLADVDNSGSGQGKQLLPCSLFLVLWVEPGLTHSVAELHAAELCPSIKTASRSKALANKNNEPY